MRGGLSQLELPGVGGHGKDPGPGGTGQRPDRRPLLASTASPAPSATPASAEDASSGYFASARLNRQQARDSALSILQDAAADETADETIKAETAMAIQTLADDTVSEAQIENLVTAKGYADCVAFMGEDSISIVVSTDTGELTDTDVAKVVDIAATESGYPASAIKVMAAN